MAEWHELRSLALFAYVRPHRTLVSVSLRRGVGGPGSVLRHDRWAVQFVPSDGVGEPLHTYGDRLLEAYLDDERKQWMSEEQANAWRRSWMKGNYTG
jgi:hypothetical protein